MIKTIESTRRDKLFYISKLICEHGQFYNDVYTSEQRALLITMITQLTSLAMNVFDCDSPYTIPDILPDTPQNKE